MEQHHDPIGKILRRMTFGESAQQRQRFVGRDPDDVVSSLLRDAPLDVTPPDLDDDADFWQATDWWLDVMRRPDAGLHERMIWFWHGHLTSSVEKATPKLMMRQHGVLRRHALGNFRQMLHEITIDPAMLFWLDGADSRAESPNENFAREVMELFALGREAGYSERDVRAGAQALAGYWVDSDDDHHVVFDPDRALQRSVAFLGTRVRTATEVVDAICDHPACARHLALSVHRHFAGDPSDDRLAELADGLRENDLDIAWLVQAIVTHRAFRDAPDRPATGLEWFLGLERLTETTLDTWTLELLGQTPMRPPNVAGWPGAEHWVSTGAVLMKADTALNTSWDTATLDGDDPVAHVLARAGLATVGGSTREILERLAGAVEGRRERSSLLHAAVAMCPEFSLI